MFQLESEDMANIGGPMGSRTTTNWRRYFKTLTGAKKAAEKDYGRSIVWTKHDSKMWSSGDLRYVMYMIRRIKVEN